MALTTCGSGTQAARRPMRYTFPACCASAASGATSRVATRARVRISDVFRPMVPPGGPDYIPVRRACQWRCAAGLRAELARLGRSRPLRRAEKAVERLFQAALDQIAAGAVGLVRPAPPGREVPRPARRTPQ